MTSKLNWVTRSPVPASALSYPCVIRRAAVRRARQTQSRHSSSSESCRRCISLVLTWPPLRTTIALADFVGLLRNPRPLLTAVGKLSGQAIGVFAVAAATAPTVNPR
jgi:hypothetical protein